MISLRSGETAGAGRDADCLSEIFPLEMTYTVQKSGTPFETLPGISVALNLLIKNATKLRNRNTFSEFICKLIHDFQISFFQKHGTLET